MRIGSLFSGIGGLELGLERAGLGHTSWQVEINPYCRAVLARHWPKAKRFEDVKAFTPPHEVEILCGGFPCQPWSVAGKRRGVADDRHLWPEFARIIDETRPSWVIGENVPGLRARGLRIVLADLAERGFDVEWTDIRASDVGAPHRRGRLFVVASHPERVGVRLEPGWLSRALGARAALARKHGSQGLVARWPSIPWRAEPGVDRVADGVPERVQRLAALGNAVVPEVAEVVGEAIRSALDEAQGSVR